MLFLLIHSLKNAIFFQILKCTEADFINLKEKNCNFFKNITIHWELMQK